MWLEGCIDFRYLTDALTYDDAVDIFTAALTGKAQRVAELEASGYPADTTTPGWIGHSDERLVALSKEAVTDGFTQIKLKVGTDVSEDPRRLALAREANGPDIGRAIDANQRWDVATAIEGVNQLADFDLAWPVLVEDQVVELDHQAEGERTRSDP